MGRFTENISRFKDLNRHESDIKRVTGGIDSECVSALEECIDNLFQQNDIAARIGTVEQLNIKELIDSIGGAFYMIKKEKELDEAE